MGISERKEREKQQRRNDIIKAAEAVFFEKGLEKSTMDDVAEKVELSKGTLYLYFKNKEELMTEIAQRGGDLLENYFVNAIKNKRKGIKKVRAIGKAFTEFFKEHSEYHEAMLYNHSKKQGRITENCVDCHKNNHNANSVFVSSIIEGIKDGSIRDDIDPVLTSMILWGHTMGMMQLITSKQAMLEDLTGCKAEEILEKSLDFSNDSLLPNKKKNN